MNWARGFFLKRFFRISGTIGGLKRFVKIQALKRCLSGKTR